MPVEIEIKLKVDELEVVRERLKQLGATRRRQVMETNIFFDTPDHALLADDCGLRLRLSADAAEGTEKRILTYKGPRAEGPVKTREEIEVAVDSADSAITILEKLGYVRMLTFEKRRESWQIEDCMVELDELPQLGSFVEIECPSEEQVLDIQKKLGLADVAAMTQTYADLVSHHLSDRGGKQHSLAF